MKRVLIFLLAPWLMLSQLVFAEPEAVYQGKAPDHLLISDGHNATSTFSDLALDWQQNSHVVWRSGREIYYAKTDKSGNWLLKHGGKAVPYLSVGEMNTAMFVPAIAVDSKGNAHIVAANGQNAILYIKISPDSNGNDMPKHKAVTFKMNNYWLYFQGADVAINPKTDLPVIGTMAVMEVPTSVGGYPMMQHQERIYGLRLNADGEITSRVFFAASARSVGCPPYVFGHPTIAVDRRGLIHAVWKTRMLVSSEEEETSDVNTSVGNAIGIVSTNTAPDPNASLAEKFKASNRHGVSYKVGDIMIEYARSDKVSQGVGKFMKFGGVYINTPGDIEKGTYTPVPRIVCDDHDRAHVAWNGFVGDTPAILYSRIWLNPDDNSLLQMGVIEQRSVQINSALAEVEEEQCDLAIGDNAVHFVWIDGRNCEVGSQVFHGAVSLQSGVVQNSQEYAISGRRDNHLTLPRIAFRPNRVFKKWVGYEGDPLSGENDPFHATDADTTINLRPEQEIWVSATYEPWLHGAEAPSDPVIVLKAKQGAIGHERVSISADDGRGQYTVVWQEEFPGRGVYDICLHRRHYWAETYGLLPGIDGPSRLWDRTDAKAALSGANLTTDTGVVNKPIPVRPVYTELVRESNYHQAQGFIADGVTPFIIRVALPVGEYYARVQPAPDTGGVATARYIQDNRLYRFYFNPDDPDQGEFDEFTGVNSFTVQTEHSGLTPRETIFLIMGFDWTEYDAAWPATQPNLSLQLKLWKRPVNTNQGLDLTTDEPFAIIPFGVSRPPVVLLHGFSNAGSGWSANFMQPLEELLGKDMVFNIDYGLSMTQHGPWAKWEKFIEERVNTNIRVLRADFGNKFIDERLEYKVIREDVDEIKNKFDEAKETVEETIGLLQALGYLEGDDDDDEIEWMDWLKKATYWEKAANVVEDLASLEKEVALNLYATEQLLRHQSGWAFTRYDVIGHCQGAILLRMLATNSEDVPVPLRFMQPANFGRGRFRSLTAIGAPFRGSRLTQYCRHYYNNVVDILGELLEQEQDAVALSTLVQDFGVGLGLLFYANRYGYLEPKFDAFNGEVTTLGKDYPVHPAAKFHYFSTVINHDHDITNMFFSGIGLVKDPPIFGYETMFDVAFPTLPKYGATNRYTDGIVDWRSHLAGLDYRNDANKPYMSFLDELNYGDSGFAAHVPPFSMKALFGVEDPEAPTLAELLAATKDAVLAVSGKAEGWKNLLLTFGEEMLKKMMKNHDVLVSPFGTLNTQTNMTRIGERMKEILSEPVKNHFTSHVEYDPTKPQGEGNPEGWGTLAAQEIAMHNTVSTRLRYVMNQTRDFVYVKFIPSRALLPPGVYQYKLDLPAGTTLLQGADQPVLWSIAIQNELLTTTMDVDVTPDPNDPTRVTVTIGENVMGTVILNCAFFDSDGHFVQISPVPIATVGMGAITGIHFGTSVPMLKPGEQAFLMVDAEYQGGYYGPLFPEEGKALVWSSSAPEVATVVGGQLTAGQKAGNAQITVTYGDFSAVTMVRVVGQAPEVNLLAIEDPLDFIGGGSVTLEATAKDDGNIADVVFFANGAFLGEGVLTGGVYRFIWNDLPPGRHELQAVAIDNDEEVGFSNQYAIEVANRIPVITAWSTPAEGTWCGGDVYCAVEANDPDGDDITVQFEFSLDGTNWSQCYYPLTAAPYDCVWASHPREGLDETVWLRVWAIDARGGTSETLTRTIKVDNSSAGLTFNPHPGETGIALNVQPTITFDKPITKPDGSALSNNDLATFFGLRQQGQVVAATIAINAEKTVVTLTPTEPLRGVTPYSCCIFRDVKDSSGALFRATSATFVTTFGAPAAIEFRNLTATGEAGRPLDTPIRVHVVDAWSNTITTAEIAVTLASGDQAGLDGTLTRNAVNGVATFNDLTFTLTGQRKLVATSAGLNGDTLDGILIRPGALARLEVTLSTATAAAGTRLSATVSAFDQYDNAKTNYTGIPMFSSSDTNAQLPGPYAFYETDEGVHTYRNTLLFKTLGPQTVIVKDGAITSPAASLTVTNTAPQPPKLISPENGGFAGLTPTLQIGAFTDVDNAGHAGTQFQLALTETFADADLVWDSDALSAVLTVTPPAGILSEYTQYFWRARVKDGSGDADTEWSAWSPPASFRTSYAFPFFDNFSVDRGWQGLSEDGWAIAAAQSGGGEYGSPDPGDDVTPDNEDRGILGYVIGGDYLPGQAACVVSPPVDCSQAQIVELSFWRWLGIEGNDWADASLLVSSDGKDWHTVWANSATDIADEQWHLMVFDLTSWAAGKATVFVAFDISSVEQAFPFCGWNIDDLKLAPAAGTLARIFLQVDRQNIEVGDVFNIEVYVQEDHPEAAGLLGASVRLDFTEGLSSYNGWWGIESHIANPPWNQMRKGKRDGNIITEMSGLTTNSGHGDGVPVLLASVPMKATGAGTARFVCTPAAAFALPSPFGQLGPWRIAGATLEVEIAVDSLEPLARLTLQGPTEPVALGNTFEILVYAKEMSPQANGFLGGPFDLYFDPDHVSAPGFSAATAIQPPYTDESLGLVSGTLLENRIDELGGATLAGGHGNNSDKLYAKIVFRADNIGESIFEAKAGNSGLTLTTPVGQLPFSRIDYGLPFVVDIRPNFAVTIDGGNAAATNCYQGQEVALTANEPEPGWEFSHWTGDETSLGGLADSTAAATTLTVPGTAVTLKANYRKIDYTLTVNQGTGSKTPVHIGDQLGIVANPPEIGKTFDRWTGDVQYLADPNAATTTATVATANITVTATYRNMLYRVKITNGTGGTETAVYGQQIQITANQAPTGYRFGGWTGSEEDLDCLWYPSYSNATLVQPARDVHLTASYSAIDYQLTVNNGSGTQIANYQDTIDIVADPAPAGQAFSHWSGDVGCLDNPQVSAATVTMPAANVTLTANYEQVPYTLLVVNGTGSGTHYYGDVVPIQADAAPPGSMGFSGWSGHVGTLADPTQRSTTLTMPAAHTAVVAIYGDSAEISTFELSLKKGWNCFAVPFETANPVGTLDSKGHPITSIWRWDNMFVPPLKPDGTSANTIQPHVGHWIFCIEDCQITFEKWQP
jgi:hypothetical protein